MQTIREFAHDFMFGGASRAAALGGKVGYWARVAGIAFMVASTIAFWAS